ncbi:TPA: recombination-associated protein RdgC [Legionella pneumophila]|uniref:recombination-associated protein RdgC n=1 Tax=Legionella pneumophila TaxID=446 RepID=UPI0007877CAC|nr:recombination-associated protein RdgC [Legionella pneumophila]MDW8879898.1 recombination-associated protein RdgC [Legionella pneumophila subsp. fraseri]MDW8962146.1 recombination-associated protein RdgC [Legionella pneumophila subsp. fraseri]MDW9034860.1 recombination-associated protein RdgC [Legionella pneumophila subsp. fraseri]MDW9037464.1 recombination-associated protein RdgC [Legionella pneumophila subsp. fraseri]MDW9040981.1 recombination-associated protein RdgC [Legionella pneumophil
MWFNNALIFQYKLEDGCDLNLSLTEEALKPCPPHARFTYGWIPAFEQEMVHEVAGSTLICLGKEERILPRGVINKILKEKIQQIETTQGRPVKRAEKAQMAEDLEFELLPKSFCVQKKFLAILDSVSQRLIINTSSNNQASQLTSFLRKSIPGIVIEPLNLTENLALRFAEWIHSPATLPDDFQLASDCLLFSLEDEKKRVHCKGYELPAEEILTLLAQGMGTAEISLIWKERVQFTLTQDFTFKKLKSLDYLIDDFNEIRQLEEEYQRQDAALTLLSGELRELINGLMKIFVNTVNPAEMKSVQIEKVAEDYTV